MGIRHEVNFKRDFSELNMVGFGYWVYRWSEKVEGVSEHLHVELTKWCKTGQYKIIE